MAKGFTAGAPSYERSRPGYPRSAIRFAQRTFHLGPESTVVDLAAGTGKLTRDLLATGARIIALEPLPAMREQFRRAVPSVRVRPGTAEHTGLPAGCADLVTVGQAFHWFDVDRALPEIHRILRPGGGLMIVYNWREERGGWRQAVRKVELEYDYRSVPHHKEWWRWHPKLLRATGFTRARTRTFPNPQHLTPKGVEERMMSISYLAALPPKKKAELRARIREVLATHPSSRGRTRLEMPYTTKVTYCFWKELPPGAPRERPARARRGREREKKRRRDGRASR